MSGLRHWWRWCGLGIGIVLVVVYLSLADIHLPQAPSTLGDKINHSIAYGALMGWFGQLFMSLRHRLLIACGLIVLGVTMEYLQGMTAYRFFDWRDAIANTLGVVVALLALSAGADKILRWFEKRTVK